MCHGLQELLTPVSNKNPKLELTWIGKEHRPRLEPRILLELPERSHHAKFRVKEPQASTTRSTENTKDQKKDPSLCSLSSLWLSHPGDLMEGGSVGFRKRFDRMGREEI
jgi:hypothetical protein